MGKIPENCSRCGAPISWEEGASIVKCQYCGYKNILKPDFYNLFISYLKLRNPKEIIRHPISRIILLLLIPLFLIINSKNTKEENVKEDYWPTNLEEFKKTKVSSNLDGKKYIFPTHKKFKEVLEATTIKFQSDIKQACIYRKSIKELKNQSKIKLDKSKYEFNVKIGNLSQVYSPIPEEVYNEFFDLNTQIWSRYKLSDFYGNWSPSWDSQQKYRKEAIYNLRQIIKNLDSKTSYKDYVEESWQKWTKEKGDPLNTLNTLNKAKLHAAEVEVLRQSGYGDWKLYSRWNPIGVGDLFFYYQEKWNKAGNPGLWGTGPGSIVYKFAFKKGVLKKSDFNKWGDMKYEYIPSVVKDICEPY